MKVLFATPYNFPVGGIMKWANHIVNYHNNSPDDIMLDVLAMDRDVTQSMLTHKFKRLVASFKDYRRFAKDEENALKKNKYDIVHISSSASYSLIKDLWMIKNAHKYGAKAIIHFHFGRIPDMQKAKNWEWKLLYKVVSKADGVVVLDEFSYQSLLAEGFKNTLIKLYHS